MRKRAAHCKRAAVGLGSLAGVAATSVITERAATRGDHGAEDDAADGSSTRVWRRPLVQHDGGCESGADSAASCRVGVHASKGPCHHRRQTIRKVVVTWRVVDAAEGDNTDLRKMDHRDDVLRSLRHQHLHCIASRSQPDFVADAASSLHYAAGANDAECHSDDAYEKISRDSSLDVVVAADYRKLSEDMLACYCCGAAATSCLRLHHHPHDAPAFQYCGAPFLGLRDDGASPASRTNRLGAPWR